MALPAPAFDYYAELEVTKSATLQEITTAYRRLARVHHPDKNPDNQEVATNKFQKIQQAYDTLSSSAGRRRYDTFPPSRGPCTCGTCYDDDEDDEAEWDSEEDEDDDYYYDFVGPGRSGAGPRPFFSSGSRYGGFTFGGSRFRSYEDMEMFFQEQERKEAERVKVMVEERKQREVAEAAKRKAKEDARKAEEDAIQKQKDARRETERQKQEERWTKAGAVTKDEKLKTCLHSDFCAKIPQRKKFKCGACGKKGGMTAFECPFCSSFLCQQCVTKFSERRARGEDMPKPTVKSELELELEIEEDEYDDVEEGGKEEDEQNGANSGRPMVNQPVVTPETEPSTVLENHQQQSPDSYSKNIAHEDIDHRYGGAIGQTSKNAKRNKKSSFSTESENSPTQTPEPPISIPGVKVNGNFNQKNTKVASPAHNNAYNNAYKFAQAQKHQMQLNGANGHTARKPPVEPFYHRARAVNGFGNRNAYNRAPFQNKPAPRPNGLPGLQPFPPPAPDVAEQDDASDNEAPTNSEVSTSNELNAPTSPSGSSRFRKPIANGYKARPGFACYVCGKFGHLARNCLQPQICYNCGGTGHMAKYCAKTRASHPRQPPRPSMEPDPRAAIPDFQNHDDLASITTATKAAIKGATLAKGITEPLLREAMECFGPITECVIDRRAGIAWTVFIESESLRNAIAASPVSVAKGAVKISEWLGHD